MAAAVIDVGYLSAYLSVPQQQLSTVIDLPTAELVRAVLEAVTAKAQEHDELTADKLRVDIELENAVRSSETRVEGLRSQIEKAHKTVEEVRTQLKEEGTNVNPRTQRSSADYRCAQKMPDHLSRPNYKPSNLPLLRQHLSWRRFEPAFPLSKLRIATLLPSLNRKPTRMTTSPRTFKSNIRKDWS